MRKTFKHLILVLSAMLMIISCGGSSGDLMGLENVLPNYLNTKVLKKVNVAEAGVPAYDINYMYAAGKLTAVNTSDNSLSYAVEYSGTQISKITRTEMQGGQPQIITSMLTYSGALLTQITGTIAEAGAVTDTFKTDITYAATKPSQIKTILYLPGTTTETGKHTSDLQYAGNNLSKWTFTSEFPAGPVVIPPIVVTTDFSNYDANPNPYHTLPSAFTLANCNFDIDGTGPTGLSLQNYKTVTVQTGGASQTENLTHIYDTAGYPTKSEAPGIVWNFEYLTL
ncbi:MAG: hypothetical protein K0M63_01805 [Weeksellaceae bacterium]|nr:hypothetical protein [Weeksellaceae bacterium]